MASWPSRVCPPPKRASDRDPFSPNSIFSAAPVFLLVKVNSLVFLEKLTLTPALELLLRLFMMVARAVSSVYLPISTPLTSKL